MKWNVFTQKMDASDRVFGAGELFSETALWKRLESDKAQLLFPKASFFFSMSSFYKL